MFLIDPRNNLAGERFGRLRVISRNGTNKHKQALWLCACDCGQVVTVVRGSLIQGKTESCGCLKKERFTARKHGLSSSRGYKTWCNMLSRCRNPGSISYPNYGGKGITVCERWHKFENFAADMLPLPFPNASIDRIDNSKGYYPENCRWVTKLQQDRNKTTNRPIEVDGVTKTVTEWCEHFNIPVETVYSRLNAGRTPKAALTDPYYSRARK